MEKITPRIIRKMKYKANSQGIINRYINVNGAWEGHLQHTRDFILQVLAGKKIENLAVYGSGWLLDLPLDEIAGMAGHIWLYDAIHPAQVIHRLRNYSNVTAVTADITGGGMKLAHEAVREYKRQGKKMPPEQLGHVNFRPDILPDYSISLNILSQLGDMISEYLKHRVPYSPEETDQVISQLQQSHLQLLQPGKSCLITDVKETRYTDNDQPEGSNMLIKCPLPIPDQAESWEWQFDPLGEYVPGFKTVSQVVAFEL